MNKGALLFRWHHWLGLVSGVLLLVVSLSGAALVFHKEIDRATFPARAVFDQAADSLQYDQALAAVLSRYPYHRLRLYLQPEPYRQALVFEARGEESQRLLYVHPQSGEVLLDIDRFSTPSRWLLKLHYTLFAGLAGNFLLALLGLSMIASLLTGLWVYRRRLLPVLLFRERLSLKSKRTFYSGTHRYIGVWSLLLNLLLAVTGIWIQFVVISANMGKPSPVAAPKPNPVVSLQQLMQEVEEHKTVFTPAFIILPADSLSPLLVYGKSKHTNPLLPAYADQLKLGIEDYNAAELVLSHEQPLGKRLYAWVIALHFGGFGGMPVKLLYCLFGLAPAWLSISGWFLYLKRSKRKKVTFARPSIKEPEHFTSI
ncbi:PepSY domain-containing protein [Cesiribacter sp. SM1]|uniref:PepSY-associated TM helix domain-containing protein n=1 Tax=Cesiribacter sp. SM1 TaxID=2861196 RepID=UPI001CD4CC94|nr:PepSY-associated TM helix domain-containing protein [Cesiribacter sp. SM1]